MLSDAKGGFVLRFCVHWFVAWVYISRKISGYLEGGLAKNNWAEFKRMS